MPTIQHIETKINQCNKCSLCKTPGKHVPGNGNLSAKIVCLGEAPGATEAELGLPFVGRAGKMLDNMLSSINLTRNDIFICNTVCCRPPDNRKPTPKESKECREFLVEQLTVINPHIIIALGNSALGAITGNGGGIVTRCGNWESVSDIVIGRDIKVMPCFHPSGLLRNPNWKKPAWHAFQEVAKEAGLS